MNKTLVFAGLLIIGVTTTAVAQHSHPIGRSSADAPVKPLPAVPAPAGAACIQQSDVVQLIGAASRLRLGTEQLMQIQAIEAQHVVSVLSTMEEAATGYGSATVLLRAAEPDLVAYEAALRSAGERMFRARMGIARADVAARAVLTAEQLTAFDSHRKSERPGSILTLACMAP
jgi:Spy/CpxP family protein refolding chaperone